MASKVKTVEQIYFSKDHQMIRRAVAEFVKKEINPNVDQFLTGSTGKRANRQT